MKSKIGTIVEPGTHKLLVYAFTELHRKLSKFAW